MFWMAGSAGEEVLARRRIGIKYRALERLYPWTYDILCVTGVSRQEDPILDKCGERPNEHHSGHGP